MDSLTDDLGCHVGSNTIDKGLNTVRCQCKYIANVNECSKEKCLYS